MAIIDFPRIKVFLIHANVIYFLVVFSNHPILLYQLLLILKFVFQSKSNLFISVYNSASATNDPLSPELNKSQNSFSNSSFGL